MEVGLCDGLKRNGSIFLIVPFCSVQFSSVPSLSRIWLFVTPGTAAHQASLSITNSQSVLKLMSAESGNCFIQVIPSPRGWPVSIQAQRTG